MYNAEAQTGTLRDTIQGSSADTTNTTIPESREKIIEDTMHAIDPLKPNSVHPNGSAPQKPIPQPNFPPPNINDEKTKKLYPDSASKKTR